MQRPLPTSALDYELPESRIATRPAEPRDAARLLVMWRGEDRIEHRHVRDLPEYLRAGDLLVFNDTMVIPARFRGRRVDTGGRIEGIFLEQREGGTWLVMLKSNSRLRAGQVFELVDHRARPSG